MIHSTQESIPPSTKFESGPFPVKVSLPNADAEWMNRSSSFVPTSGKGKTEPLSRGRRFTIDRARRVRKLRSVEPSEGGATIVEFAIVSVAFFALVLGTIDFSMAMFEMNGVNFGTRSQARSAL